MKIIKAPCEVFRAKCPQCYAILEYGIDEITQEYVQCPCCGIWIRHITFGRPFRESEEKV